jgi:hypothetical protein
MPGNHTPPSVITKAETTWNKHSTLGVVSGKDTIDAFAVKQSGCGLFQKEQAHYLKNFPFEKHNITHDGRATWSDAIDPPTQRCCCP